MVWHLVWHLNVVKKEGELSRGRMKYSHFFHKCWVQTLNHSSYVNQCMEGAKKHGPLHKDLAKNTMKWDTEAIGFVLECLEQNNPFDLDHYKQLLKSFSTGFTSSADDAVNADRAAEIERKMMVKLDGQLVISTVVVKFKVRAPLLIKRFPKSVKRRLK